MAKVIGNSLIRNKGKDSTRYWGIRCNRPKLWTVKRSL